MFSVTYSTELSLARLSTAVHETPQQRQLTVMRTHSSYANESQTCTWEGVDRHGCDVMTAQW